jgi:hypothetical protein
LKFVFDSQASVNVEAIYCPVNYGNAVFGYFTEGGSSVTRLQGFTISEEQDAEFKDLINGSCEREVLAAMCGFKRTPGRPGLDDDETRSQSSNSSLDSSSSEDEEEWRVRKTTRTRTLKPNVRLLPMRAAARS